MKSNDYYRTFNMWLKLIIEKKESKYILYEFIDFYKKGYISENNSYWLFH